MRQKQPIKRGHWIKLSKEQNDISPIVQQIGLLNLRISDMMIQLNTVVKTMIEENAALKKQNSELKGRNE
jgi:regulator of replication initiation timing